MVDLKVLEQAGTTTAALKKLCEAKEGDKLHDKRKAFELMIQSRVQEGVDYCACNHKVFMAVDLAWDAPPVGKETIPLQLYAQGKLDMKTLSSQLEDLDCAEEFVDKNPENGNIKVNLPKLYEVSPSILRSIILRRVYAQTARYSNRWPFYNYEPRSTLSKDKLRAEITSQRMEIMSDQFGHRHFWSQTVLDSFLYGFSTAFPSEGWSVEKQIKLIKENNGNTRKESIVDREGINWVKPHPTRVFWDTNQPLAALNQGIMDWVGYWDVCRYGEIEDNPAMWNTKAVGFSSQMINFFQIYSGFFSYYYGKNTINGPKTDTDLPSLANERKAVMGTYSSDDRDSAVFLTNLYVRIKPNQWGTRELPELRLASLGCGRG
jgi:hypothetical protein